MATKKTNTKRALTDAFLKNLKRSGSRQEYRDAKTSGLTFRVNPGGTKAFVTRYRSGKSVKAHILGQYPEMSLAKARKELIKFQDKIRDGVKPIRSEEDPKTVAELAERFYADWLVKNHKRPDLDRMIMDNDIIPNIGKKRLTSVTPARLSELVRGVVDRGATTLAGRVVGALKQLFAYAVANGWMEDSPAVVLNRRYLGVENNIRERALDVDAEGNVSSEKVEIRAFWNAMETVPRLSPQSRHGLRILLLTGVRSGELRLAQWKDVNLDAGTWFVPADNTKTGVAWTVSLSDLAVEQFRKLQDLSDEWVLPSAKGEGPLTDKALARALKRLFSPKGDNPPALDTEPFRPHDLRRTVRTHLGALGVPPHVCEKCLNHSLGRIAKTYDKNTYLPERREALQKWADVIDIAVHDRQNLLVMRLSS